MELKQSLNRREHGLERIFGTVIFTVLIAIILGFMRTTALATSKEDIEVKHYPQVAEQVKRGDFEFRKVHGVEMTRLANIPFLVTSKTTGEAHVIVSDENGEIRTSSTWNSRVDNANLNDAALTKSESGSYFVDESLLNSKSGIWFGSTDEVSTTPDDDLGALPFDVYTVKELPVSANKWLTKVEFEVVIERDNYVVNLGTVEDYPVEIITSIKNEDTNDQFLDEHSTITLVDKVTYSGLKAGQTYTMVGTLHYAQTNEIGEVEDLGTVKDEEGNDIVGSSTFTANKSNGDVDVEFVFDTDELGDKSVVAYEECYLDDELIAEHKDIAYLGQTVTLRPPDDTPTEDDPTPIETNVIADALPKTGDNNLLMSVSLALLISSIALAFSVLISRRIISTRRKGE